MNARGTRRPRGAAGPRPRRARGGGRRAAGPPCLLTLLALPLLPLMIAARALASRPLPASRERTNGIGRRWVECVRTAGSDRRGDRPQCLSPAAGAHLDTAPPKPAPPPPPPMPMPPWRPGPGGPSTTPNMRQAGVPAGLR